jgi:N-acetyltransferase
MDISPVTLEGRFMRLEPMTFAHEQPLIAAAADGELWNTDVTIIPRAAGMKDYIQYALDSLKQGNQLPFVIASKAGAVAQTRGPGPGSPAVVGRSGRANNYEGQIVGTTRFYEILPNDRKAAIGYTWLARSAQRTPINTEAKLLLLTHAFETWKLVRVELITDVRNEQSRAAILRLGAKQEGILRKHLILPSGRVRDSVVFSITDDEWPEVKAILQAKLRPASPD